MKRWTFTLFIAAMVAIPVADAVRSTVIALGHHGVGDDALVALKDIARAGVTMFLGLVILRIAGGGRPRRPLWLPDRRALARWRARLSESRARA